MNFAKKLVILTIVIICLVSYGLYYVLHKYDFSSISDQKLNQTTEDLHGGPSPSVDNEFKGIYYLLTLTLAIILECSQCKLIEYEVRKLNLVESGGQQNTNKDQDLKKSSRANTNNNNKPRSSSISQSLLNATIKFSKSRRFVWLKQTSLSLVNNFCGLLLMLLLCYSIKLVFWAALGKSFGYFLFKMPKKKIHGELDEDNDSSFLGRSQQDEQITTNLSS